MTYLFSCLKVISRLLSSGWNKKIFWIEWQTTCTMVGSSLVLLNFSLWYSWGNHLFLLFCSFSTTSPQILSLHGKIFETLMCSNILENISIWYEVSTYCKLGYFEPTSCTYLMIYIYRMNAYTRLRENSAFF